VIPERREGDEPHVVEDKTTFIVIPERREDDEPRVV